MTAGSAALGLLSVWVLYSNASFSVPVHTVSPGLEISLHVDRLSALFLLTLSVVSFAVSLYSVSYAEREPTPLRRNLVVSATGVFVLSMALVVASATLFAFLFFWEVMALSSFLLVMADYEKRETRKAGLFYFAMTQLSTLFLLLGTVLLFRATGSFDIRATSLPPSEGWAVFLAFFVGFGIKAGVVPFHKWLPYAHPASPSNVSALMSGVMIKIAIYGLMRLTLTVLQPPVEWGLLILAAGTASAFLGVIYALKEHDLKRLLAYHSIENVGIILIGFGLYVIFTARHLPDLALLSLAGALFHTLNHGLFKGLLFLTAGSVVRATGTRNIEEMGGLARSMPRTAALFLVGAVSISALPPLNGFASELMIFQALFQSWRLGDIHLGVTLVISLSLLALTGALAAACFVKAYGTVFLAVPRSERARKAVEVGAPMLAGPAVLAVLCVLLGLFAFQVFSAVGLALPIPNLLLVGAGLLALYGLAAASVRAAGLPAIRVGETWGCGILSPSPRMEYTASGFSEPLVTVFRSIYRTKKQNHRKYFDPSHALFKEGAAEIHLVRFFEEYLYLPVARAVERASRAASRVQNGDLDTYMVYVFATALLLLVALGGAA